MLEALREPRYRRARGAACGFATRCSRVRARRTCRTSSSMRNDEAPLSGVASRTGLIEESAPIRDLGTHSTAGFALAVGPAVRPHGESGASRGYPGERAGVARHRPGVSRRSAAGRADGVSSRGLDKN